MTDMPVYDLYAIRYAGNPRRRRGHKYILPFAVAHNIADMMLAHDRIPQLAGSRDHVAPSHDPQVMLRYPAPRPDLDGLVVRLDVAPERV